ncbi:MAG: alpha/beta hydrolase [Candidatus Polarisedimenticolaceae bacterium]|nr:alpha/beta hydrolase [Candidatus Polarisedimenticolaceae bacterium]
MPSSKKATPLFVVILSLIFQIDAVADNREDTVCGFFKEPLLFWLWSSAAPAPDDERIADTNLIKPTEFITSDEKTLRGYKYLSHDQEGNRSQPVGYILMALGNAMISDQIISSMKIFSEHNYDVYIYDYRGYGNSDGSRRINAIIEDYKELVLHHNQTYRKRFLYGISLGGAVMLNVIGSGASYDAAVIDSSPSLLSDHGCPERIDPIANLPSDAKRILIITGQKDPVLNRAMTSKLRELAADNGAKTVNGLAFSHPFMDKSLNVHRNRMQLVLEHFLSAMEGD